MSSVRFARPFLEQVLWWQTFSGFKAAATAQIARVRRGIVGLRGLLLKKKVNEAPRGCGPSLAMVGPRVLLLY